jgi:hypothetical protein
VYDPIVVVGERGWVLAFQEWGRQGFHDIAFLRILPSNLGIVNAEAIVPASQNNQWLELHTMGLQYIDSYTYRLHTGLCQTAF